LAKKLASLSLESTTTATKNSLQYGAPITLDENSEAIKMAEHRVECLDHLALKVDEVHRPILLENGGKKDKPRTGAVSVARTQADTPTFERILLVGSGGADRER
jgi:hypothetical protein